MNLVKLHKDSRELLEQVADRLPQDLVDNYRSYSDVGEWGMLVDVLCASLIKRKIPITPQERDKLAQILAMYERPVPHYKYITNRDQTVADLTVIDHT